MGSHETNLKLWVLKQLDAIQSNASGRAHKELRGECEQLKEHLRAGQLGTPGSTLSIPFPPSVADPLLAVLKAALATSTPKLAEPALACLHKLVAYAYLQGETRPSGRLDDASNLVTRAVGMASRAGASSAAPVQLSVVKTLLTLATAEHFVCHGDTLMQAVRTVFNIAVGGASEDIKVTARSALLQMLNTIVKRVAQQIITPGGTPMISPIRRFDPEIDGEDDEPPGTVAGAGVGASAAAVAAAIEAAAAPSPREHGTPTIPEEESTESNEAERLHQNRLPRIKTTKVASPTDASAAAAQQQQHLEDTRTAHLANLAEQADIHGLELAMVAPPADQPPALGAASFSSAHGLATAPETGPSPPPEPSAAFAAAITAESKPREPRSPLLRVDTPPDPRRALMRERRAAEWRRLTVPERDAVIVISAMCKMAAREAGVGAAETVLHTGKLLALDMLVKVLTNPAHDWSQVRREFAQQLRQPLCLALLRNCVSPYDAAVEAAVTIFGALLAAPRLREFMKSEIGALYPLLLLRPLEGERPDSPAAAAAALGGLAAITASPQVLVDIFVNYDCNLQAANLFERSMKALSRFCQVPDVGGPLPPGAAAPARATALRALLAAIKSMDTWAGPLKTVQMPENGENGAAGAATEPLSPPIDGSAATHLHHDVLQKIQTDKAIKASLESGIAAFNADPVKGLAALVASGAVPPGPAAAAAFLRESEDRLDPAAVGELLGHHSDDSIAVMRAYIAEERYAGLGVDAALRRLLHSFRLPGEAQKIDRLMEAFAARYCAENPGIFPSADAPYLLAFAIIMLNTDAHNPMAEARISAEDFVTMCVYQTEAGEYEQILPGDEILALYRRITDSEIEVRPFKFGSVNGVGEKGKSGKGGGAEASRRSKLAAALGLGQLAAPFWSGASWDKQHGVGVERQRLLELTGQLLAGRGPGGGGGGAAGPGGATLGIWHAATHAEHARPMMQVCGPSLGPALSAALARAATLIEAAAVLDGFEQAIRLAALLRLETLCEGLVARLAEAARLGAPAPPQTPEEARQVAALSRLIALGTCSEAGALGSAWVVLLRALSELEALKSALTPGSDASLGATGAAAFAATAGSAPRPTTSPAASPSAAAGTAAKTASSNAGAAATGTTSSSFLGRLFSSSRTAADAEAARPSTTVVSERAGRRGPLAVRTGPGLGAVLWAETAGAAAVDGVFSGSATLDGDAVLTFFRALAAVSQEELDPGVPDAPPRAYLLHRLVEVAAGNSRRIRIVWQRLWPVVSQHLVSAACHVDPYIAMFAVDAMRQLADRLLSGRGGGGGGGEPGASGFAGQGDALRPLGAVLRCSDRPAVRELAVACVAHLLTAHSHTMGPAGWRAALAALTVAAADPAPAVVAQAMDVLSSVFAALYETPGGHAALRECLGAALAVVRNTSPAAADLVPSALYMVQGLARRLSEGPEAPKSTVNSGKDEVEKVQEAWAAVLGLLAAVARTDPRPKVADAAAAALFQVMSAHVADVPASLWAPLFAVSAGPLLALGGAPAAPAPPLPSPPAAAASPGYASAVTRRATPPTGPLPAPSAAEQSPEGAARVLRQAGAHLPELWALLAAAAPTVAGALLGPCLRLLRDYAESSIEPAAGLGTRQLHALLAVAGPALPPEGWSEVEAVLGAMMEAPVELPAAENGAGDGAAAAAALRRRCRSSLIAMRCVGEMLAAQPAPMPPAVQLRLLGALEVAVTAAAALNADPTRRAALAKALDAEDAAALSLLSESINKQPLSPGGSGGDGAPAVSPTAAGFAAAVRVEAGDWDRPVLPALLRHEVEGGRALAAALRRGAAAPDAPALRAECEARLATLALRIVREAAARLHAGPPSPARPESAEEAVRAALVRDALVALAELPPGAWRDARAEVIGHAARLVCSQELAVRRGVQALLRAQAAESPALRGAAAATAVAR